MALKNRPPLAIQNYTRKICMLSPTLTELSG